MGFFDERVKYCECPLTLDMDYVDLFLFYLGMDYVYLAEKCTKDWMINAGNCQCSCFSIGVAIDDVDCTIETSGNFIINYEMLQIDRKSVV